MLTALAISKRQRHHVADDEQPPRHQPRLEPDGGQRNHEHRRHPGGGDLGGRQHDQLAQGEYLGTCRRGLWGLAEVVTNLTAQRKRDMRHWLERVGGGISLREW